MMSLLIQGSIDILYVWVVVVVVSQVNRGVSIFDDVTISSTHIQLYGMVIIRPITNYGPETLLFGTKPRK